MLALEERQTGTKVIRNAPLWTMNIQTEHHLSLFFSCQNIWSWTKVLLLVKDKKKIIMINSSSV